LKRCSGVAGRFRTGVSHGRLRAEREQGITIDVAYRHFATPRRRFIIADTPATSIHAQHGHGRVDGAMAVILTTRAKACWRRRGGTPAIAHLLGIRRIVWGDQDGLKGFGRRLRRDQPGRSANSWSGWAVPLDFIPVVRAGWRQRGWNGARTRRGHGGESGWSNLETVPLRSEAPRGRSGFQCRRCYRHAAIFRSCAAWCARRGEGGDAVKVLPSKQIGERIRCPAGWSAGAGVCADVDSLVWTSTWCGRGTCWRTGRSAEAARRIEAGWYGGRQTAGTRAVTDKPQRRCVRGMCGCLPGWTLRRWRNCGRRAAAERNRRVDWRTHRRSTRFLCAESRHGSFIVIDPVTNLTLGAGK